MRCTPLICLVSLMISMQLINTNMTLEQGTVSPNAQGVIYLPQGSSSSDREAELSVEEDESMASALDQVLSAPQNAASHHVQADFSSGRSTTSEESTITDTACITSEWCFQPCQQDGTTDDSGQEGNVPYIAYNVSHCCGSSACIVNITKLPPCRNI